MESNRRGRPRKLAVHEAILDATRDLLVENGYAALSMEGIASRTGVGKPTLYRRWASKGALVAETVRENILSFGANGVVHLSDTGDIEGDLRSWLQMQAVAATDPQHAPLILALAAAAAENPSTAQDLYLQLAGPRHDALVKRLRAGMESGEVRADANLEAVVDAFSGALIYQLLTGAAGESGHRATGLLDVVLRGLRP